MTHWNNGNRPTFRMAVCRWAHGLGCRVFMDHGFSAAGRFARTAVLMAVWNLIAGGGWLGGFAAHGQASVSPAEPAQVSEGTPAESATLDDPSETELSKPEATEERAKPPASINANFTDPTMDVEEWVERFEGESREIYAARNSICELLKLRKGMKIADVGAGTGFFSRMFAKRVGDRGTVYAVEISPVFLKYIRDTNARLEITNIIPHGGREASVNLPKNSVDVVFVCDTYHHFEYPEETMKSIFESLVPSGQLLLIDFEREVGRSREWILGHVRAGKGTFRKEIESVGFRFVEECPVDQFRENYLLRFTKPSSASADPSREHAGRKVR